MYHHFFTGSPLCRVVHLQVANNLRSHRRREDITQAVSLDVQPHSLPSSAYQRSSAATELLLHPNIFSADGLLFSRCRKRSDRVCWTKQQRAGLAVIHRLVTAQHEVTRKRIESLGPALNFQTKALVSRTRTYVSACITSLEGETSL